MHTHFIVHYDLKPQNILLTSDLHVKISDFDQAIKLTDLNPIHKQYGTLQFTSPESISAGNYDNVFPPRAADI